MTSDSCASVSEVCQPPDMLVTVVPSMPPSVTCSAAPGLPPVVTRTPFSKAGAADPVPRKASSAYVKPAALLSKPCGIGSPDTGSAPADTASVRVKLQQSTVSPAPQFWMSTRPQKARSSSSKGGQVPGGGTVAAPRHAAPQPERLVSVHVPLFPAALQALISSRVGCRPPSG